MGMQLEKIQNIMYTLNVHIEDLMMKQVNITELRQNLPSYLSSVQKGAEIWVTSHGRVIAHILPPTEPKKEAIKKLEELRKHCVIGDVISPVDLEWDVDQ